MKKNESLEIATLFNAMIKELKSIKEELKRQVRPDNKQLDVFDMDYTPTIFSRAPITTQNEALEQIMLRSGMMKRETWEVLAGIQYDAVGDNIDDDDFLVDNSVEDDVEFKQSPLASYYERKVEKLEVPNVETKKVDVAPAPEQQQEVQNDTDRSLND